ncbi:MAG TPA: hypothetical protein VF535_11585 [Allosphingosinicella sp.]
MLVSPVTPRSDSLILLSIGLAMLHHVDHVLRADHSGWPVTGRVTPFTFSLTVYLFMVAALMLRGKPWLRFLIMVPVFFFAQFAHMGAETPHDQYNTWASGVSDFPDSFGQANLLGMASPTAGYFAVVISVSLSLALAGSLWSLWSDWRRRAPS